MEFSLVRDAPAEAVSLGVPVFKGETSGPGAELDAAFVSERGFEGKAGEVVVMPAEGGGTVIALGMGPREAVDAEGLRRAAALLVRTAWKDARVATTLLDAASFDRSRAAQAIAEGATLGLYRFDRHKKADEDATEMKSLTIIEHEGAKVPGLRRAAERGAIVAEAANFARDLANEPSNVLTPTELAARTETMAREHGLGCRIYDRAWAEEMGMGSFLGVAKGSAQPPKFIVLTYQGAGEARPLGLIGKGITFDTGGISIKPAAGMEEMKGDMSGAACVIAAMMAIARLKPAINVTALAPATENMPGGNATKPGDVLRAMNGKTIEVINTDAEGRLILADALSYACKLDLSPVIDVATLTGAISIALGDVAYGVFTNSDPLLERVKAASAASGEKCWPFPLFNEYKENIKSNVADMKNSGGRGAGSINAAFFLKEFVDDRPWAHLDIAGVDFFDKEKGVLVKGASGVPVRTLVQLALDLAERPL